MKLKHAFRYAQIGQIPAPPTSRYVGHWWGFVALLAAVVSALRGGLTHSGISTEQCRAICGDRSLIPNTQDGNHCRFLSSTDNLGSKWPQVVGHFQLFSSNLFPHSGVFVFFGSHCNANPHLRPQVGGVEVHFDWCFALKHRKLCKNEEKIREDDFSYLTDTLIVKDVCFSVCCWLYVRSVKLQWSLLIVLKIGFFLYEVVS